MKTLKEIQKRYMKSIHAPFKPIIEKWVDNPVAQEYIEKAWDCELSDKDRRKLSEIGSMAKSAEFRYLYWLTCIYMHPLTIAQHVTKKVFSLA